MSNAAVYLFETGAFKKIPGLLPGYPVSLLPFWGNSCLVDFIIGNFNPNAETPIKILLDDAGRGLSLHLSGRWKRHVADVIVLEDGINDLIGLVESEEKELVILCSLSAVSLFDPGSLLDLERSSRGELIKTSIQKTPLEMYIARRRVLLKLLSSRTARAMQGSRSRQYLFEGILASSIDLIEEIPGRLLFQNDIMDFYRNNLWLASHGADEEYSRSIARLPELAAKGVESRIAERGYVKDSFLATGAEVDGYVENSVLFPHVVIRSNARISNSVIATNNRIGSGSTIENTVILPFTGEGPRNAANIGDNCSIGGRSSLAKNQDYPDQIVDGLTVVGMDVIMPNGFRAEPGSYIGPESSASKLRRQKTVKRGMSFIEEGK